LENITIHIIDIDGEEYKINAPVNKNATLMDVLQEHEFSMGNCGGMALCASCHCYIKSGHKLISQNSDEENMLDQLHNSNIDESRLICQIPLDKNLNGIKIQIAKN
jgi:ferredoxin